MSTVRNPGPTGGAAKGRRGGRRSTSWKPGQSGNLNGRPKLGLSWKLLIADFAESKTPPELRQYGNTWAEALMCAAFRQAILGDGNERVLHEILERSDSSSPAPSSAEDSNHAQPDNGVEEQIEHDRQQLEHWHGDPDRQKRLADLQAQRLELDRQISELFPAEPGGQDGQDD